MSTTTPNLGLTLPIGTERVSRQIVNDNNMIIDTFCGNYVDVGFINTAVDLNTLVTDNAKRIKRWRGDTCVNLTHAPSDIAVPWELEVGCVGSNINYQYQDFRLYTSPSNGNGSKIFRRQKYYYAVNDFRWNDWVSLTDQIENRVQVRIASGTVASISGLGQADIDMTLSEAFTNGANHYWMFNNIANLIFPICIKTWSDSTHVSVRVMNSSNTALTNASVSYRIFGIKA